MEGTHTTLQANEGPRTDYTVPRGSQTGSTNETEVHQQDQRSSTKRGLETADASAISAEKRSKHPSSAPSWFAPTDTMSGRSDAALSVKSKLSRPKQSAEASGSAGLRAAAEASRRLALTTEERLANQARHKQKLEASGKAVPHYRKQ